MMKRWLAALFILSVLSVAIGIVAFPMDTYDTPLQAMKSEVKKAEYIPAYTEDNQALFFFRLNDHALGAAYSRKNWSGWRSGMMTWSDEEFERIEQEHVLNHQGHGDTLIFGLFHPEDNVEVMLGDATSNVVPIEGNDALAIWYFEREQGFSDHTLRLVDKQTGTILSERNVY
ncbi:hypothetical protein EQV77_04570 [Halobacillus fulvus]|nr:hypothetical protein EQV77_04570 [Halobacillus fulvus]